jgi:hypothetical protein
MRRERLLSSAGEPLLGELRGIYMAERRRQAFRVAYGREPAFKAELMPDDDFVRAYRLVNIQEAYRDFDRLVRTDLDELAGTLR